MASLTLTDREIELLQKGVSRLYPGHRVEVYPETDDDGCPHFRITKTPFIKISPPRQKK